MNSFVLKASLGEDVRRVTVSLKTLEELRGILSGLFPEIPAGVMSIKYADEDGDMVSITSDLELNEALTQIATKRPSLLRVYVARSEKTSSTGSAPSVNVSTMPTLSLQSSVADITNEVKKQLTGIIGSNELLSSMIPIEQIVNQVTQSLSGLQLQPQATTSQTTVPQPQVFTHVVNAARASEPQQFQPQNKYAQQPPAFDPEQLPQAQFIADVTVPDGQEFNQNTVFTKTWTIGNNGMVAWPAGSKLVWVQGDLLGAPAEIAVPSIAPSESTDISILMRAPEAAGKYKSIWRMSTPSGHRFGHRLWAEITVVEAKPDSQPVVKPSLPEKKEEQQAKIESSSPIATTPNPTPVATSPLSHSPPSSPAPLSFFQLLSPLLGFAPSQPAQPQYQPLREDPAPAPAPFQYADALTQLEAMGFADREANKRVLLANHGDILASVHDLLGA